jgi:hypothetical protein
VDITGWESCSVANDVTRISVENLISTILRPARNCLGISISTNTLLAFNAGQDKTEFVTFPDHLAIILPFSLGTYSTANLE